MEIKYFIDVATYFLSILMIFPVYYKVFDTLHFEYKFIGKEINRLSKK